MAEKKIKVLVVDDDKAVRDFLLRFLKLQQIEAQAVEDGPGAIELAKKEKFDLVFLDIRLLRIGGVQVFIELKKINPAIFCIFMTGYAIEATLLASTVAPGTVVLRKPFENISHIKDIIDKVMEGANVCAETQKDFRERRAFIRLNIVLEIDYKVKQDEGPFIHSLSKDFAPGGIRLLLREKLSSGAVLDIVMRVSGCDSLCRATGEVVWVAEASGKPGYYEAGIKLIEVDFSQLSALLIDCGKIPQNKP